MYEYIYRYEIAMTHFNASLQVICKIVVKKQNEKKTTTTTTGARLCVSIFYIKSHVETLPTLCITMRSAVTIGDL